MCIYNHNKNVINKPKESLQVQDFQANQKINTSSLQYSVLPPNVPASCITLHFQLRQKKCKVINVIVDANLLSTSLQLGQCNRQESQTEHTVNSIMPPAAIQVEE